MPEYIDREAAILKMKRHTAEALKNDPESKALNNAVQVYIRFFIDELKECKSCDVAPIVHGKWTHKYEDIFGYNLTIIKCSICGTEYAFRYGTVESEAYNYCPNCGAKMEVEHE